MLMRGLSGPSSFSELARYRFKLFLMALFRTYEELYQLHKNDLVDADLWVSSNDYLTRSRVNPSEMASITPSTRSSPAT